MTKYAEDAKRGDKAVRIFRAAIIFERSAGCLEEGESHQRKPEEECAEYNANNLRQGLQMRFGLFGYPGGIDQPRQAAQLRCFRIRKPLVAFRNKAFGGQVPDEATFFP